jgi:hypothetical protein
MTKKLVQTYEELSKRIEFTIEAAYGPVVIIGGHYPITEKGEAAFTTEDKDSFGCFSSFTLDLSLDALLYAKKRQKDAKLVVVVDDHAMMHTDKEWYLHDTPQAKKIRETVEQYFSDFQLPKEFQTMMQEKGLSLDAILKSEKGLAFQESWYREQFAQQYPGVLVGCAGEYTLILRELAKRGVSSVIALIPDRCKTPTCNAVHKYILPKDVPKMKTMHIYLESGHETPEDMLFGTIQKYSGIPIIRE